MRFRALLVSAAWLALFPARRPLTWIHWFNHRRVLGSIGDVSPAEFEAMYDPATTGPTREAGLN